MCNMAATLSTVTRKFSVTTCSPSEIACGVATLWVLSDWGASGSPYTLFLNFLLRLYTCYSDKHVLKFCNSVRQWILMGFAPLLTKILMTTLFLFHAWFMQPALPDLSHTICASNRCWWLNCDDMFQFFLSFGVLIWLAFVCMKHELIHVLVLFLHKEFGITADSTSAVSGRLGDWPAIQDFSHAGHTRWKRVARSV